MRCAPAARLTNRLTSVGSHITLLEILGTLCDSGVEMQGRSDEVDVVLEMLGNTVFITADVGVTSSIVLVKVVLGVEQRLCLVDRGFVVDPVLSLTQLDTVGRDSRSDEPVHYRGDSLLTGSEVVCHFLCSPVLTIIGRCGMTDIVQVVCTHVDVALCQSNLHGDQSTTIEAIALAPAHRGSITLLMDDEVSSRRCNDIRDQHTQTEQRKMHGSEGNERAR